ncbi:hypothetical protein OS493_022853 [Desmophyllum pertusum]|uniref:Uncharacterized protein n=1 Tax=Desmophyllum pertusum TaxID=174260 RepID=A0A9X0D3D4_9CNID|nr:hypothetical protein OS493_022853 [Desmophyllum pertusum]
MIEFRPDQVSGRALAKVARRTWKFERMSYKAFTEFLNYSREAKELLGTSPLLKDQTGDRLQTNGGYREPGDQMRMGNENAKVLHASSPDANGVDVTHSNASYMKTSYNNMDSQQNAPNSWATCSKTLQSLLEQYLTETSSLSSLKQVLLDRNNSQVNDSDVIEETQEHVNSQAPPPPLLHRPIKRSLEQSHVTITSPDPKRSRLENYCAYAEQNHVRISNETSHDAREEMFEKTRSFGNPSKTPIGPPPPLLKQPQVDKNEQEFTQRQSPQVHYAKEVSRDPAVEWTTTTSNGGCKNNATSMDNVTRNTTTPRQHFQQTGSFKPKLSSPSSNGNRKLFVAEPLPRQIEGDDKASCGGYAFDHTAMPKIVAVHSVSRGSKDDDEWERNKAFISKAKANQNNSFHTAVLEEQREQQIPERTHWQSTVSVQNQRSSAQDPRRQKPETNQSMFANSGRKSTSEEVSFERYVLYHLLSKFQGNVEQVKRVLKQNLLQEWLAYSHGSVDPRQQTFEGVNFYELRKFYDIWRQLQRSKRTNEAQRTSSQTISNTQNSEPNRVKTASNTHYPHQQMCFRNSQSSPNSQYPKAASRLQGNYAPKNVSNLNQAIPQTLANGASRLPSNSQRVYGGVFEGATRSPSNKNLPGMHIQEKMYNRSQNSAHGTINPDRTPASAVFHNQHNINSPQGSILPQSSTNQLAAFNGNQATLTLRSDMRGGHTNITHMPSDQVKTNDIRPSQGNVLRSQCETFGRSSQRNVLEQERMDGASISPAAILRHFPQTTSKPTQNQSSSFFNSKASSSSTVFRKSTPVNSYGESVQGQRHPLEQAARSKDAVRGQETKASYLWAFQRRKVDQR